MEEDLYHWGVKGMKWGVRKDKDAKRLKSYESTREFYKKNSQAIVDVDLARSHQQLTKYESKAAKLHNKALKNHSKKDADVPVQKLSRGALRAMNKSRKQAKQAAKLAKAGLKKEDAWERVTYTGQAANMQYKSEKNKIKSERLQKKAYYGKKAMKYELKALKNDKKAAKVRRHIARLNYELDYETRRIKELTAEIEIGRKYIDDISA